MHASHRVARSPGCGYAHATGFQPLLLSSDRILRIPPAKGREAPRRGCRILGALEGGQPRRIVKLRSFLVTGTVRV